MGIKRTTKNILERFIYDGLGTKQKEFISNVMTQKQKDFIKSKWNPGYKRKLLRKIVRAKYKLYDLGFKEKGLVDLKQLAQTPDKPFLRKKATWELAIYYANQYQVDTAQKSVDCINQLLQDEQDQTKVRRYTILQAENLHMLGKTAEAKQFLSEQLAVESHPDLYLAYANLVTSKADKLYWINLLLQKRGLSPVQLAAESTQHPYDRLQTLPVDMFIHNGADDPMVSIIMPVYNAGESVKTALESVLNQTWRNIEVLVVDDCSTDNTMDILKVYQQRDNRVKVLSTPVNSGPYVARNIALQRASGDFVTINDADDWSHPEKIKTQVTHLINHPHTIANFSQQARLTNQLTFYRRGKGGIFIFSNMSSFMFRKQPVLEKLGYWDSVRFAGDSEFVKRVKLVFGEKAITHLQSGPLSFQRQSSESLTGDGEFGFPGFFMGARKEYAEAHNFYHQQHLSNLYMPFPQQERLYPVPYPMLPERKKNQTRHFDVIIASEFRLTGGTNMSNIEEIKAQRKNGLKTGLMQMYRYDLNSAKDMNPKVRELIDGDQVQMLVYGENVTCDVLILRHPPILQEKQQYLPNVQAKKVCVIINQPPQRDYTDDGVVLYDLKQSVQHLHDYFGQTGKWYPIGPQVRDVLHTHHETDLKQIHLSETDWVNIIDVMEWKRPKQPKNKRIVVGRHSRDQYVKWPDTVETLHQVYPTNKRYEIRILGGAKAPKQVLGGLPANWHVWEFGDMDPKQFLKQLDVFVYYTHPKWVEAFGRVIFEAMAVGVPVILPPIYKPLFGDAAIYAEPSEVQRAIRKLMKDKKYYKRQVEMAWDYVEEQFGYRKHIRRLEEVVHHVNG